MIIKKTGVWLCAFTLQVSMTSVFADEIDEASQRSWYLGAGLGITELDPDTNNTGYSVTDERDTGFKLFGGYDAGMYEYYQRNAQWQEAEYEYKQARSKKKLIESEIDFKMTSK